LFLTFFTLLGLYLWSRNRHWWAGFAFGLALGCKWSAIYFIAVIALITLYRILVADDIRETPRKIAGVVARYGLLPLTVYTLTWLGWFLSDRGWDRQSSSNPFIALINYHTEMLSFHVGLTEKHPYQSHPLGWLLMLRPTSFFYDAPKGCSSDECSQEVLALGTPFLWWIGTVAILFVIYHWIKSLRNRITDNAVNIVIIGLVAGYLPWFALPDRTVFTFYAIIIQPFLILAIVYCAKLLLETRLNPVVSQSIIAGGFTLIFICFLYFLPLFTGQLITYDQWQDRMWFDSWI
jgi:dolichyl-phosphate-mannose--protein O-mannosyl transferase